MTITVTAMVMLPSPSDSKMSTYSFLADFLTKSSVLYFMEFVRRVLAKGEMRVQFESHAIRDEINRTEYCCAMISSQNVRVFRDGSDRGTIARAVRGV